jgi:hypothetical protein
VRKEASCAAGTGAQLPLNFPRFREASQVPLAKEQLRANPEYAQIYQEEAAKSALWLQLVEARQRAGLSQAEVAKRMGSPKPKSPALRRLATMSIP